MQAAVTKLDDHRGRLPKTEARAKNLAEHAVEEGIARAGQKNEQGDFESGIKRLERRAPESHGRSIQAATEQNDRGAKQSPARGAILQHGNDFLDASHADRLQATEV